MKKNSFYSIILIILALVLSSFIFVGCKNESVCASGNHAELRKIEASEPTCVSCGNVEYYKCSLCGKTFRDEKGTQEITNYQIEIDSNNHPSVKHVPKKASTCAVKGNVEYYQCNSCGKIFSDSSCTSVLDDVLIPFDSSKHVNVSHVSAVASTDVTFGNIDHYHCSDCSKNFSDSTCQSELSSVSLPLDPDNKKTIFNIACVGDSLTYNAEFKGENYPDYLRTLLNEYQAEVGIQFDVHNFGVSGSGVTGYINGNYMYDRKYSNLPKYTNSINLKPDIVIFMIGTNDCTSWTQAQIGFERRYRALIESYIEANPNVKIYIGISPPANRADYPIDTILNVLNPIQRSVAEDLGLDIVDICSAFSPMDEHLDYYRPDNLHPSALGSRVMAELFAQQIKSDYI